MAIWLQPMALKRIYPAKTDRYLFMAIWL